MTSVLYVLVALAFCSSQAGATTDEQAIKHLLHSTVDKPQSRLVVEPVVVAGTVMMIADGGHPPVRHAQAQHHDEPAAGGAKVFKVGPITIDTLWLRATPKGAKVAGGYMRITNTGSEPDRLVGGTLERAGRFEVHEMTMVKDVMQMRPLPDGLDIKPGQTVALAPGGFHIMGMELQGGFTQGQTVRGTLRFEKAGTVDVEYAVRPIGAGSKHRH